MGSFFLFWEHFIQGLSSSHLSTLSRRLACSTLHSRAEVYGESLPVCLGSGQLSRVEMESATHAGPSLGTQDRCHLTSFPIPCCSRQTLCG